MSNCIKSSFCCAPIRWVMGCCKSRSSSPVTEVALKAINHPQPQHHHRTKTWRAAPDGKMRYEASQTVVVKVETPS